MNGAVAYAGMVKAERSDLVSRYYDTQGILIPPPLWDNGEERPSYLITANALVWRLALAKIGGFNEHFPSAGEEDIDLGLRLGLLAHSRMRLPPRSSIPSSRNSALLCIVLYATDVVIAD